MVVLSLACLAVTELKKFNDGVEWRNVYGDIKEARCSQAERKDFGSTPFVDSDHPGDELFSRLRTAPIIWYSKLPGDCEDVGFGAVLCSLQ
jgi:hypothetical protein